MQLIACEVAGYRSLHAVRLPLARVSVLVGENGVGKSNMLRSLELLQAAAAGTICRLLADEGGLGRVLWAGRSTPASGPAPTSIRLTARFAGLRYSIEIAAPAAGEAALPNEPTVREETLAHTGIGDDGSGERIVMHRQGSEVRLRDARGQRQHFKQHLLPSEAALHAFRDSASYPELAYIRQLLESWRIYDRFDLSADAASRAPSLGVCTPALAGDGGDLASALATIFDIKRDPESLLAPLRDAFPGASLEASVADGQASFRLRLPDIERPLQARELSEGALKYICLIALLSAYRKPALIAINEPEAGLHESFLPPLARLIARSGSGSEPGSQICIVTQSSALAREIAKAADIKPMRVVREEARTRIEGVSVETPARVAKPASGDTPAPSAPRPTSIAATDDDSATVTIKSGGANPSEPELDAQIEEVRSLTAARAVLAEIRKLIGRLREHPDELADIHPKIEARLAKLRDTAVALPPEFAALTGRLDEELRSMVAKPGATEKGVV
ncbi:MAG: AAA family ATPase [Hyphomicrobiaceae bacterium]